MRIILRAAAALCLLFTSIVFVARALGSGQESPAAAIFTNPDGTLCEFPCMFGVRPGELTFLDASRIVRSHPLVRRQYVWERYVGDMVELIGTNTAITLLRDRRGLLASVSMRFEPDSIEPLPSRVRLAEIPDILRGRAALGEIMNYLGTPEKIQLSRSNEQLARMYYPQYGVLLTSQIMQRGPTRHLSATDELRYLGLSAPHWFSEVWRGPMLSALAWDGFGAARRYAGMR